jgi:hypothetical protein
MKCSRCQQDHPLPDAQFCPRCGAPVKHADESGASTASHADLLEQQTATSEILRVISSSPTDLRSVFDTIVRNAARVCEAFDGVLALADGDEFVQRAHHGSIATVLDARYPLRGTVSGRAILEARIIQGRQPRRGAGLSGRPGAGATVRLSHDAQCPVASRRSCYWRDRDSPHRGTAVHRPPDQAPADLRGPGRDRHRERPALQGARGAQPRSNRGARPANGD